MTLLAKSGWVTLAGWFVGATLAWATAHAVSSRGTANAQGPVVAEEAPALPDLLPGEGWHERSPNPPKPGHARAWSDAAAGCHLALFSLPASDNVGLEATRTSLDATLAQSGLTIGEHDDGWIRIGGDGLTGLASLRIVDSPVRSARLSACYWNEREPSRCQTMCEQILQTSNDKAE